MVYLKTRTEKVNSKEFARRLVTNSYNLKDGECLSTKLVYSSEWSNPTLYRVKDYHYKMYYLVNQMQREMTKLGVNISASKIKEDSLKKEVVIYQKMLLDRKTGRLVDYFFILDSTLSKVLIFRRETDFSQEQNRVYRAVKYLHDEMFMDYEKIYWVLQNNGFDVTSEAVSHIVSEFI
jgi:hypothetical protein